MTWNQLARAPKGAMSAFAGDESTLENTGSQFVFLRFLRRKDYPRTRVGNLAGFVGSEHSPGHRSDEDVSLRGLNQSDPRTDRSWMQSAAFPRIVDP